jgi:hypothetical protein
MGIRLVAGRLFDATDRFPESQLVSSDRNERGAAIVSLSTARALWPGQPAIGQTLWLPDIDTVLWREVVGVVEDIQFHAAGETPSLHVFVPWTQMTSANPRLLVRGTTDAAALAGTVRDIVQAVEPGTFVDQVVALDALVSRATAQPRFTSRTAAALGALALGLAAVGIYGTLSYLVGARTREIGIRLALGASRAGVMSDVLVRSLVPATAGGAIGLASAYALARAFRALFFDVAALDLASFVSGAMLLLAVALAAALGPARRAARVDPATALRAE